MRYYQMTLLLLPMLLFMVGCSVDTVEESDANILEPSAAPRTQNLPVLDNSSLIPTEEVPVITIEKTREDDDFYYWQLKADPAPTRADLVVGVEGGNYDWLRDNGYIFDTHRLYVPILKFEKTSTEIPVPIPVGFSRDIAVTHPWVMIGGMHEEWADVLDGMIFQKQNGLTPADLPPIRIANGYVIPRGFQFTYYSVGEPSLLEIHPKE